MDAVGDPNLGVREGVEEAVTQRVCENPRGMGRDALLDGPGESNGGRAGWLRVRATGGRRGGESGACSRDPITQDKPLQGFRWGWEVCKPGRRGSHL